MIGQRNRKGTLVTRRAELLKLLIFAQSQERDQDQGCRIDGLYNVCPPELNELSGEVEQECKENGGWRW